MVEITIIISQDSQKIAETLEHLATQTTGWNRIFINTQLRRYRIAKRDSKPFNLSTKEMNTLSAITAQLAANQGGEG